MKLDESNQFSPTPFHARSAPIVAEGPGCANAAVRATIGGAVELGSWKGPSEPWQSKFNLT